MLLHLVDRMRSTGFVVVVATGSEENERIIETCKDYGVSVMKGFEADVMSRLAMVGDVMESPDIIRVTGDNPLTSPEILKLLTKVHLKNKNDYTYIEGPPTGTRCEVIKVKALKTLRQYTDDLKLQEDMTPALKTMKKSQKVLCPSEWLSRSVGFTVDTPSQMAYMQKIFNIFHGPPDLNLADLIGWAEREQKIA